MTDRLPDPHRRLKRVAFLFGAGASAFCGPCIPANPPLGAALQRQMTNEGFWPSGLPADVLVAFELGFEHGMDALHRGYDSSKYNQLVRAMARYFARYLPAPRNYYRELLSRFPQKSSSMRIASLNYENLVEHALLSLGGDPTKVMKPHGSCSFLPYTGEAVIRGIVARSADWAPDVLAKIEIVIDPSGIAKWFAKNDDDSFAPAMSFFAPLKLTKTSPDFIAQQRALWSASVEECDLCFVIGVACNPVDEHIWGSLLTMPGRLIYVNPCDGGFPSWVAARSKSSEHWRSSFKRSIPKIILRCS